MDVKKLLSDSMVELLEHKTIDRITVRDVLEKSGVSRATFYKYFDDKMDLMMYPFFSFMERNFKSSDANGLIGLNVRFLQFLKDHQKFFENAFKSEGQNSCERELRRYGIKAFEQSYTYPLNKAEAELTPKEMYVIEFYAVGAFAVVQKWVEGGMKESPQMLGELIYSCMPEALRTK